MKDLFIFQGVGAGQNIVIYIDIKFSYGISALHLHVVSYILHADLKTDMHYITFHDMFLQLKNMNGIIF